MGSVNRVYLVGNLGKDPKTQAMNNGDKVGKFTLATSEGWKDKNSGEWTEKTEWHNVVVWNEFAIKVLDRCQKGTTVAVEGSLQTRKYTDANGVEKYSTEVVVARFKGDIQIIAGGVKPGERASDSDQGQERRPAAGGSNVSSGRAGAGRPNFDDDIPF